MTRWRFRPILIVYISLTLWALKWAADTWAPFYRYTVEGCTVGYVYDGDTIAMSCNGDEITARLLGFDTPETRDAACAAERIHGNRATLRLRELVAGGEIGLNGQGRDRYGRALVSLSVDGEDVGDVLIREGLALRYSGGQRANWCERLGG